MKTDTAPNLKSVTPTMSDDTPNTEIVRPGKRPTNKLAGPYGHPFHPMLVALPIGAWTLAFVFDLVMHARSAGSFALFEASYWAIAIGIVGAAAAAVPGLLDWSTIPRKTRAYRVGLTHMAINVVIITLFAVNWFARVQSTPRASSTGGQVLLTVVALMLLSASGWLGGKLAYRYGIRVADEETQREGML